MQHVQNFKVLTNGLERKKNIKNEQKRDRNSVFEICLIIFNWNSNFYQLTKFKLLNRNVLTWILWIVETKINGIGTKRFELKMERNRERDKSLVLFIFCLSQTTLEASKSFLSFSSLFLGAGVGNWRQFNRWPMTMQSLKFIALNRWPKVVNFFQLKWMTVNDWPFFFIVAGNSRKFCDAYREMNEMENVFVTFSPWTYCAKKKEAKT